jgi:nucleotide-binding universal stress UspA family protein
MDLALCRDAIRAKTVRWLFFKGKEMNIKTIPHPTDFSAASRHALELAYSMARDNGARVVLLNVVEPPFYGGEPLMPIVTLGDLRTEAENWFATLPAPRGEVETQNVIAEGDPVTEILRVAAEERADFIVLGTHGRTGLQRLLMGNVAENVTRRALCPVVAVKSPARHPADEAHVHEMPESQQAAAR